nr:unnamed protein product [Callosobruchus chinensis]
MDSLAGKQDSHLGSRTLMPTLAKESRGTRTRYLSTWKTQRSTFLHQDGVRWPKEASRAG